MSAGLGYAEWAASHELLRVAHSLVLCGAFVLVGPWSWRRLLGGGANAKVPEWVRAGAFVTLGAAVVLAGGLVPPAVSRAVVLTDASGLPASIVLFVVGSWGLGRDVDLVEENHQLLESAEPAQLLALRSQLDPHFLFNTLNAIAEWCREDPEVAEAATLKLAAMLRTIFDGVKVPRWSLARDVALAGDLWMLHHTRDPERFSYRIDPDVPDDVAVPPLLLLPIAENAMTHGVWGRGGSAPSEVTLEVSLGGRAGDEMVEPRIDSPGRFGGERAGGHGLDSTRRRLRLAYGEAASLEVESTDERTRATLRFPKRRLAA